MIPLNERLDALGVPGVGPLYACRAISDDGTVIVFRDPRTHAEQRAQGHDTLSGAREAVS